MSGIGAKLSRHVLGMKFMRKTKSQIDKDRVEKVHREHFAPAKSDTSPSVKAEASSSGIKNEPATPTSSLTVEELWSYNQCERYIFGRQSFGGFNPVVENNVKKGIWKPFYMEESEYAHDDSEEEEGIKKNQSDVDVSDEEMSKTYGSLIGTLAKRFTRKNKRGGGKGQNRGNQNNYSDGTGHKRDKKQNKKGRFRNNKREAGGSGNSSTNQSPKQEQKRGWGSKGSKKRQRESTGSTNYEHQEESNSRPKRRNENNSDSAIPQKRRKFMKPSDD